MGTYWLNTSSSTLHFIIYTITFACHSLNTLATLYSIPSGRASTITSYITLDSPLKDRIQGLEVF